MSNPKTLESICMTTLKSGGVFYSHKKDKDLTALACYYKAKIKTERVAVISQDFTVEKVTKVTIL